MEEAVSPEDECNATVLFSKRNNELLMTHVQASKWDEDRS
jgi:hypothetical protein